MTDKTLEIKKRRAKITVIVVLIGVALFTLMMLSLNRATQHPSPRLQIMSRMGTGNKNEGVVGGPGGLGFFTQNRWGLSQANFYDYGFDGSLDLVVYFDNQQEIHEVKANAPDWNTWLERYLEVRYEATTGEKPESQTPQ